jgi:arylsulfatase A-like enzyme
MRIEIEWPDPALAKAAPLVFLAAFAAVHGFLKIFSFYTALYCEPSGRLHVLFWLGSAVVVAAISVGGFQQWYAGIEEARPEATTMPSMYRIGDTYAEARPLHEGSLARYDLPIYENRGLTLRWAVPPETVPGKSAERAYVTVLFLGGESDRYRATISLESDAWSTMYVPSEDIPEGTTRCTISWTHRPTPSWMRLAGFTPVVRSNRQLLVGGPLLHQNRAEGTGFNFVIIGVDGLSPVHMSAWDYERRTTPLLDRFAHNAVAFPYGYTSAPEPREAYMSLLTGVNPLCHGYFGGRTGPLPEGCEPLATLFRRAHYATAAFTEGEFRRDLDFGSGFEKGFEWFDGTYEAEEAGSQRTLDKAREWMEEHRDRKFLLFVRVSELADMKVRKRYGTRFMDNPDAQKDVNLYDTMLEYVDTVVGGFAQYIRDTEFRKDTCVLLVSPYAMQFSGDGELLPPGLSEDALRIPMLYYEPGLSRETRTYIAGLEDVVPAISRVAGVPIDESVAGRSFLLGPVGKDPVSMMAEPFRLSVRTGNWRYNWQPGVNAFGKTPMPGEGDSRLYRAGTSSREVSISADREQLVAELQARLAEYVRASYKWRGADAEP